MRKRLIHEKKRKSKFTTPKIIKSDEDGEFTAINMTTRLNNPRDRLGIGPAEPKQVLKPKVKPKAKPELSSSSSSSSESSCSSSSSDFDTNDEMLTDYDLLAGQD